MASVPYLVLLPTQDSMPARTLVDGVEGMVVMAETSADAIAMCKSLFEQDSNIAWNSATATQIVADTNLHGWTLDIVINTVAGALLGHVAVTGDGSVDPPVAATGSVNVTAGAPSDGDQFDIAGTTYTFKTALTPAAHEVLIGGSAVNAIAHLVGAITFDGGAGTHAGTNYVGTVADPNVTAVVDGTTTKADITALVAGTAGNALVLTAPTNVSTHLAVSGGTLTGGEDTDSFDTMANAAVVALNAGGFGVTNAAYNASTNVLTCAGTADNLGDHQLVVSMYSADRVRDVPVPGLVGTITHEGSVGAALTVALSADNYVIPIVAAGVRQVV